MYLRRSLLENTILRKDVNKNDTQITATAHHAFGWKYISVQKLRVYPPFLCVS